MRRSSPYGQCKSCRDAIFWMQREHNRKWIPIVPEQDPGGPFVVASEVLYQGQRVKLVRLATKPEMQDPEIKRFRMHICSFRRPHEVA